MKRQRRRSNGPMVGDMMSMGVGNIVGTTMIGATAGVVAGMPAGTAKTIAGMAPALQSTALVGANLGVLKKRKMLY